ncbi:MAG: DUF4347 domain-containing protein, partial [Desulfoplanes sp.]
MMTFLKKLKKILNSSSSKHSEISRDMGRRPLYYEALESRILLSSDPAGLLAGVPVLTVDQKETEPVLEDTLVPAGGADTPAECVASEETVAPAGDQLASAKSILFVDPSVVGYESLLEEAEKGDASVPEIHVLDESRDGLEQITEILAGREDVDSVHILSHGDSGTLRLGSSLVDQTDLQENEDLLDQWKASLAPGGDILLYGCNVAAGEMGSGFVDQLARLTGADVAASTDDTGSSDLGGDWDLEYRVGDVDHASLFLSTNEYEGLLDDVAINGTNGADSFTVDMSSWKISEGSATDVTFSSTDKVVVDGKDDADTLTINGTDNDDTITFSDSSITVNGTVFDYFSVESFLISGGEGNDLVTFSGDLSGLSDLSIDAESISLAENTAIHASGSVSFNALSSGTSSISLASGSSISGAAISLYAEAVSNGNAKLIELGGLNPYKDLHAEITLSGATLAASGDLLVMAKAQQEKPNLTNGIFELKSTDASVTVTDSFLSSTGGDVEVGTSSSLEMDVDGVVFPVRIAVVNGTASAKTMVKGSSTISAAGDVSITASTETSTEAVATAKSAAAVVPGTAALAISDVDSIATADVLGSTTLTAGGNLLIDAQNMVSVSTVADGYLVSETSGGGLAVAVSIVDVTTHADLSDKVVVTGAGNVIITADTRNDVSTLAQSAISNTGEAIQNFVGDDDNPNPYLNKQNTAELTAAIGKIADAAGSSGGSGVQAAGAFAYTGFDNETQAWATNAIADGSAAITTAGTLFVDTTALNLASTLASGMTSGGDVGVGAGVAIQNATDSNDAFLGEDRVSGQKINAHGVSVTARSEDIDPDLPEAGAVGFDLSDVNDSENRIDCGSAHGLENGQAVVYTNGGGTSIGGLVSGQTYYVITVGTSSNTFQLASSEENAENGTAIDLDPASASGDSHGVTPVFDSSNAIAFASDSLDQARDTLVLSDSDTVTAGDVWTVVLDDGSGDIPFSYTVTADDAAADDAQAAVAAGLVKAINDTDKNYLAWNDGQTLTIVQKDGTQFDSAYLIRGTAESGTAVQGQVLELTDTVVYENGLWTVTLTGGDGASKSFSYTATTSESRASNPQNAMAAKLAEAVNAGDGTYSASYDGDELIVVRADGTSFTAEYTASPDDIAVSGTDGATVALIVSDSDVVTTGDIWTVALILDDGTTDEFSLMISDEDEAAAPLEVVAAGLAEAIDGDTDDFHAWSEGTTIFVVQTEGTSFTAAYDHGTSTAGCDAVGDTLDLGTEYGWETGQAVVYHSDGGADMGGLSDGTTYYVIADGDTTLKLAASAANAEAGTAIDLDPSVATADEYTLDPVFLLSQVDSTADTIDLGYEHGLHTGQVVVYCNGGGADIAGLETGGRYYAIVL